MNMTKLNRILVPIDFSDASLKVLPFAEALAASSEIQLHLLHVDQPSVEFPPVGGGVGPQPAPASTTEQLESKLAAVTTLESTPESRVKRSVAHGSTASSIVDYSKDNDIDLIVMTTHGHTGLTRFLMGSVAESVVRTAECPVMTLNAGAINND